ncbi:MAG: helix-turn-helix transcriptional regulator [Lachnospiraceae bacterium]|nr:helix-turn-helix transcriptional regulator [Lachnospiraceae bacterium]
MDTEFIPTEILLVFGTNIRKSRERLGYTISDLAASIKYDRGCLSALEYGEQNIEYITALNLARKLDVSFPDLFSRNYINNSAYDKGNRSNVFKDDDYLLVFIENFKREVRSRQIKQIELYAATDIRTETISRIINRKAFNPTIKTLYAMSYMVDTDMYSLFSRTTRKDEVI